MGRLWKKRGEVPGIVQAQEADLGPLLCQNAQGTEEIGEPTDDATQPGIQLLSVFVF